MESEDFFDDLIARAMVDYAMRELHRVSTAADSCWDYNDPSTMEIIVTAANAELVYGHCKSIRSVKDNGLTRKEMSILREARQKAHQFLYAEANDPDTPIQRKIELVRLTSRE